ncbi:MAG: tRNA (guanosine(37)-N1)-methyltransferase TrmD [Acidimicrobiaceae bacterium]|jgi:tRNA (guanine37-N1)-methyltransferase|nr:tRNA (guanosine(37)-N1)-methyltransferase TrmD [Acidimicrobiaceae bacterium]|tara:strand:- start:9360 stop:10088 length:729 start_codon:yes stop_codon:yes gene_type:complete
MKISVFTIFPEMIDGYTSQSILGRSKDAGLIEVTSHDLRDQADDPHRTIDDSPFGGGPGMVLMSEPVFKCVETVNPPRPLILLSPSGRKFDHLTATELSELEGFSLLCGRYEGVDERIRKNLCDDEISIGDYVLAGGELAALVVIEAVVRLRQGVLGNEDSKNEESFVEDLLEHPHYTRPAEFRGEKVPSTLLSGNHEEIRRWRKIQSLLTTIRKRPDLIDKRGGLTLEEKELLQDVEKHKE